ncbi:MAG: hypothetical protein H7Y33_07930 [Cytophagales bacterium]|nr:hypothetical protein [Rhizobacter sp.]
MKIIGISLYKPRFYELTAAVIMGAGLWTLAVGLLHVLQFEISRADAGALLVVVTWGCVSARLGIRIGQGHRHLAASLLGSASLLALYEGARVLIA